MLVVFTRDAEIHIEPIRIKSTHGETMKENLIRLPGVMKITGFCRSQIYRLINIGEFPKQIHISPGSVAWLESELEDWMEQRIRLSRENNSPG